MRPVPVVFLRIALVLQLTRMEKKHLINFFFKGPELLTLMEFDHLGESPLEKDCRW